MRLENTIFDRVIFRRYAQAFTLVEMLTVMAVIVIILGIAVPVVSSLQGNKNLSSSAYTISDMLDQARSYAMGNNTYVFFGLAEYNVSQPTGSTQAPGTGRVAAMFVASRDGTSIYDPYNLSSSWGANANASTLIAVSTPQVFNNLHLVEGPTPPASPNPMARPSVLDPYQVGSSTFVSATPFGYPLGLSQTTSRYYFTKVIIFSPEGNALVIPQTAATVNSIPATIELGIQQTHGSLLPPSPIDNPVNYAAIQYDGLTGASRVFR